MTARSGAKPPRLRWLALLGGALALLLALAVLAPWGARSPGPGPAEVQAGALDFVVSEPRLALLAGAPVEAAFAGTVATADGVERLDYAVGPYHVLVDVVREDGRVGYRIACVSTRGPAEREAGVDACLQEPVRLPNAVS